MTNKREQLSEADLKKQINELKGEIVDFRRDELTLLESINDALKSLEVEDIGWPLINRFYGINASDGWLELGDIKKVSLDCHKYQQFVPFIKHAVELRTAFIWGKGVVIPEDARTDARGRKSALSRFKELNHRTLFSTQAREMLESSAAADGLVLALGHKGTKRIKIIPLIEITGIWVDKDFGDEIIAYQRTWNQYVNGKPEPKSEWYYTARYEGNRAKVLTENGKEVPVSSDFEAFDIRFNRLPGKVFGLPDTAPALPAYQELSKVFKAGVDVQLALASLIFKVTNKTAKGNTNSAVRIANMRGSGNTANLLEGQDMAPFASAGKGYDFNSTLLLAAPIASNYGISVIDLLSYSAAAGSSYGAAQTLNTPRSKSIAFRQLQWADWLEEIIQWATGVKDVRVQFPDLEDTDSYRETQSAILGINTGALGEEQTVELLNRLFKFTKPLTKLPDGYLIPNNEKSLARRDIDADGAGGSTATNQASPNQGRSNGTGGQVAPNDIRTDTIS